RVRGAVRLEDPPPQQPGDRGRDRPRHQDARAHERPPPVHLVHDQRHRDADHGLQCHGRDGEERGVAEGVPERLGPVALEDRGVVAEADEPLALHDEPLGVQALAPRVQRLAETGEDRVPDDEREHEQGRGQQQRREPPRPLRVAPGPVPAGAPAPARAGRVRRGGARGGRLSAVGGGHAGHCAVSGPSLDCRSLSAFSAGFLPVTASYISPWIAAVTSPYLTATGRGTAFSMAFLRTGRYGNFFTISGSSYSAATVGACDVASRLARCASSPVRYLMKSSEVAL